MKENAEQKGQSRLTITMEYGPVPYTLYLPNTKTVLANQWEVNVFMMEELKREWGILN